MEAEPAMSGVRCDAVMTGRCLILETPRVEVVGERTVLSSLLRLDGDERTLRYSVPLGVPVDDNSADPFFPVALLLSMFLHADLRCLAPVSARLKQAVGQIQDLWQLWSPRVRRCTVTAETQPPPQINAREGGSFFSAGIDSFYTLFSRRNEIAYLISVLGFDVPLSNRSLWDEVLAANRRVASEVGLHLIVVETNVREVYADAVSWEDGHGAALAGVALLLAPLLGRVFIPASWTAALLLPYGSHPLLDPLWSTERTTLVHDAIAVERFDKLKAIYTQPIVLETLRVCWQNGAGTYNCCQCRKCLTTMVMLRALGVLSRAATFPARLDLKTFPRIWSARTAEYVQASENILRHNLRSTLADVDRQHDPELVLSLECAIAMRAKPPNYWRRATARLRRLVTAR